MFLSHDRASLTFLLLLMACLLTQPAHAQDWRHDPTHLSMTPPNLWLTMDSAKLALANQKVSHITGTEFIGGFEMSDAPNVLVFPYMLVQFKPYNLLPEGYLPVLKPATDYQRIMLAIRMTGAFKLKNPLHHGITTQQFIDGQSGVYATLVSLDDNGNFALNGTIPQEDGSGEIQFHTHGVMGKHGVALVTLFGSDHQFFEKLGPLIEGPMKTLAFDPGYAYADMAQTKEQADVDAAASPPSNPSNQKPTYGGAVDKPDADAGSPDAAGTAPPNDSSTLLIILGVLGGTAIIIGIIVIVVMQSQKSARRSKRRAPRRAHG